MNRFLMAATAGLAFIFSVEGMAQNEMSDVTDFLRASEKSNTPDSFLKNGLTNRNPNIRSSALYALWKKHGEKLLPELKKMAQDPDRRVRRIVRLCAEQLKDRNARMEMGELLKKQDHSTAEGYFISKLINGIDLSRRNLRLSENPEHDQAVNIVGTIPLPESGWRFLADRANLGLKRKYFESGSDDIFRQDFSVGKSWLSQGIRNLEKGWYRLRFRMPERWKDFNAVELHFPSVDTIAYVWLNGTYVGSHDDGRYGFLRPFDLDVTNEIRWDAENILTVLVQYSPASYSGGKGGILKPLSIQILK